MMTIVARLCAVCAVSALMEISLPVDVDTGALRLICGLLMLRLMLEGVQGLADDMRQAQEFGEILDILMR